MGKLLLLLSMMSLILLYVLAVKSPDNPVMWLASASHSYQYIRLILSSILFIQLVTRPPRHLVFRFVTALIAVLVGAWTIGATYNYQMQYADTLAFLIASLAIGITSLEYRPSDARDKSVIKSAA